MAIFGKKLKSVDKKDIAIQELTKEIEGLRAMYPTLQDVIENMDWSVLWRGEQEEAGFARFLPFITPILVVIGIIAMYVKK